MEVSRGLRQLQALASSLDRRTAARDVQEERQERAGKGEVSGDQTHIVTGNSVANARWQMHGEKNKRKNMLLQQ